MPAIVGDIDGGTVKLARLYQPRNPRFWLLIVLNALSTGISHILRSHDLPWPVTLVLAAFALANFAMGIGLALQLMKAPSDSPKPAPP